MGNTRNTGYLQNIVVYDANDNITLPARLAVTGTVSVNNTTPYDTTQFSLDVNGGLIVKNINKTAQFVLINSNPASGGNNAFVVHTVGGTSASSYADIQGYYGTSIAGSTVLRLNPQGGNVLVGSLAGTGSRMVVASSTGVLSTQAIVTLGDLSGVSTARTITINGTTQDLSANRTWTLYTDDISEDGSPVNLWFTNARARAAISVTGSGSYDSATGVITVTGGVTAVNTKTGDVTLTTSDITEGTRLYYTDTRVGTYLTSNSYATQSYVTTQIANLVDSAPGTLDTLNELAAALGDDPNFATSVATSIGTKQAQLNGTGFVKISGTTISYDNSTYLTSFTETDPIYVASSWYSTTNNASNWNTAYGWGNHASAGYLTTSSAASTYASLTGAYANPAFVASLAYSKLTGVPSTFTPSSHTHAISEVTGLQTALDGKQASGSYAAASHSHSISDVTGLQTALDGKQASLGYTPYNSSNPSGYISSYTETDTLATVTGRGSSTSATLTSTNSLGLYVNSGAASYIGINSTSNWSYVSHLNNGSTIWDVGAFNGGQYEIRPYGGSSNRVTVQLNGQFSVNNSQNQVALFQSGNANTWVDIISTGGTWSLGAAGNNRFAIYNRGGSEGTRFEVSTSAAWVNGNQIWHAGNLTNLNQLTNGPGYITGNQTITLSGDVSGSGTTSISVTIGASRVTNAMLANSSFNIGTTSISLGRASAVQSLTGVRISGIDNTYGNALVQSGAGRTDDANGDTWIFADSLGSDSNKWGIRHDQVSNRIDFWGNNTKNSYIQLNTGVYFGDVSGNASTATNVAWTGVTGRPTALSSFTNDLGNYGGWITSSGSISGNAATAGSSNFLFLQSTSNLRTVTSAGIYREEQPDSGYSYTTTLNMNSSDGRQQLTIERGGGGMKFRGTTSGSGDVSWSDWRTVWHSANLTNLNQLTNGPGYITGVTNISGNAGTATSATQVVTIQDSAPGGASGKLWWESDTGKLKVYYGSAWVDASPIPDSSLFFAKAGGVITGDVSIGQTLNVVGNTLVQGNINAFGDITAYSSSDSRLKDNITIIESPLEKLSKINGVSFNWNDKQSVYEVGAKDYGVIAQEVEEVLPELVTTRDNGYKAVRYEKIVSLLIEAIKEQQTQINNLTDKLNKL